MSKPPIAAAKAPITLRAW
jgi:hypothetical protein